MLQSKIMALCGMRKVMSDTQDTEHRKPVPQYSCGSIFGRCVSTWDMLLGPTLTHRINT